MQRTCYEEKEDLFILSRRVQKYMVTKYMYSVNINITCINILQNNTSSKVLIQRKGYKLWTLLKIEISKTVLNNYRSRNILVKKCSGTEFTYIIDHMAEMES